MAKHSLTKFQQQYGVTRNEYAQSESVKPETITMRVSRFGTPWQRRKIPTKWERKYGRTLYEICEEQNLHPSTVTIHENHHGDAFHRSNHPNTKTPDPTVIPRWRTAVQGGEYWRSQSPWLHPRHPDYELWRSGKMFPDEYVGGSKMTSQQVEQMMLGYGWLKYGGFKL